MTGGGLRRIHRYKKNAAFRGVLWCLFGEQVVDQSGGTDDDADNHEDHHHAHTHVLQVFDEGHGIKLQIEGGVCQKIHIINLP